MADLRDKSQSYYATRLTNRMGAAARRPAASRSQEPGLSTLVTMGSLSFSADPHREAQAAHAQDLQMQGHAPSHAAAGMMHFGFQASPGQIGSFGRLAGFAASGRRAVEARQSIEPNGLTIDRTPLSPAEKAETEADEADAKAREERGDFANHYTWQKIKAKQKRLGQVAGVPGHEAERDQLVHDLAREHERIEATYEKATRAYKERQALQRSATGETFVRHQRRGDKTFDQTVHKRRRKKGE